MATNPVSTYLKYANLQMAAEAILPNEFSGPIAKSALTNGNGQASRFADVLADQLISDGGVVGAHQANTPTGFSGTLFERLMNPSPTMRSK